MGKRGRKSFKEMGITRIVKKCASCGESKGIKEFCVHKKKADGHSCYCRSCTKKKSRDYYLRNREKILRNKPWEKYQNRSLSWLQTRKEKLEKKLEDIKEKMSQIEGMLKK